MCREPQFRRKCLFFWQEDVNMFIKIQWILYVTCKKIRFISFVLQINKWDICHMLVTCCFSSTNTSVKNFLFFAKLHSTLVVILFPADTNQRLSSANGLLDSHTFHDYGLIVKIRGNLMLLSSGWIKYILVYQTKGWRRALNPILLLWNSLF